MNSFWSKSMLINGPVSSLSVVTAASPTNELSSTVVELRRSLSGCTLLTRLTAVELLLGAGVVLDGVSVVGLLV